MNTVMFKIELFKPNGGTKQIADVGSVERMLTGYWHIDKPYGVDETAVRDALPISYHKAYKRSSKFWYDENGNANCYLRDAKNKRLIVPDKALAKVLGSKPVDMLKLSSLINKHIL